MEASVLKKIRVNYFANTLQWYLWKFILNNTKVKITVSIFNNFAIVDTLKEVTSNYLWALVKIGCKYFFEMFNYDIDVWWPKSAQILRINCHKYYLNLLIKPNIYYYNLLNERDIWGPRTFKFFEWHYNYFYSFHIFSFQ